MSRQRLTIGTFGDIGFLTGANGRVVARARYRDWDGKNRLVQATGDTQRAAELALKAKLAERTLFQPGGSALTPDSPFPDLVAYWLEDLELEDRLSKTTLQLYERNMRTLVLPAFEHLTLREIGVARCDHFSKQLADDDYLPRRDDFDLQADISASDSVRVIWAYLLGLLEVGEQFYTNHPGLVVFDEPKQQSAKDISFAALLKRASGGGANRQVIFATSEPIETLNSML